MPNILFVCTANQFRSPIAAGCFSQRLIASGAMDTWKVMSAGTWATPDLPAHPLAIKTAADLGIDLGNHVTREVDESLISSCDLVVVMEAGHKEALEAEFPGFVDRIVLLGQVANMASFEIPDPAKDKFMNADQITTLIYIAVQKAFSRLMQLTLLIHDGYSPLNT